MDFWEKLKNISTVVAAVLIPIIIGLTGHYVTKAVKEKEIQGRFVELAVKILDQPPDPGKENVRKWAVDVINQYSGVTMDNPTKNDLIKNIPLAKDVRPRIDNNMMHLHPAFRNKVATVLDRLQKEGNPLRLYEGFRSPDRQQYLYEVGVSHVRPWLSLNQYGVRVSLVGFKENNWFWNVEQGFYKRLQEIAREEGLEPDQRDPGSVSMANVILGDLRKGHYPPGGDQPWAENLSEVIQNWRGEPKAPPPPKLD